MTQEERVQAVLMAAVHVVAETNAADDRRKERLDAWVERLSSELRTLLNMEARDFRILLHRTFQQDEHLYPFGDTVRYDDTAIARGDFSD